MTLSHMLIDLCTRICYDARVGATWPPTTTLIVVIAMTNLRVKLRRCVLRVPQQRQICGSPGQVRLNVIVCLRVRLMVVLTLILYKSHLGGVRRCGIACRVHYRVPHREASHHRIANRARIVKVVNTFHMTCTAVSIVAKA